jgi:hypothetical protein
MQPMVPYIIIFCTILLSQAINIYRNKTPKDLTMGKLNLWDKYLDLLFKKFFLAIFLFVFFAAFHGKGVGLDTWMYIYYFDKLQQGILQNFFFWKLEFGYSAINAVIVFLHLPYWVLQLVIEIIAVAAFYKIINKRSKQQWLSWLLFLALGTYAQTLNLNRQMLALSFLVLAVDYLLDKKYWQYLAMVILATIFHKSSVIALVLLPFSFIPLNNWKLLLYVAVVVVASYLFKPILVYASKFLNVGYIAKYLNGGSVFHEAAGCANIAFTLGMAAVFLGLFIFRKKLIPTSAAEQYQNNLFLTMFLLTILLRVVGAIVQYPTLMQRLAITFFFSIIILLPNYLQGIKRSCKKLYISATIVVVIASFVYMYCLYAIKQSCGVVPYTFVFGD